MQRNFLLLMFFFISMSALTQITISGRITDMNNDEPLIGASIVVKGTTQGAIADIDGYYTIEVNSENDVLVFSFVGYLTEEIMVGSQSSMNVALTPDLTNLEEVVVTAIGIKAEKKSLGYSVQEVKGDDITTTNQANMVNSLSSKVAGVEVISSSGTPGASSNIVIRGRTSLSTNNSPLFVIDGVPMDNSYDGSYYVDHSNRAIDVNSNDIESISVLKGASATALFGIRAANGAIIITTKSGQGRGADRRQITLRTTFGIEQVNKLPQQQNKYAQGFFDAVEGGEVYSNTSTSSWGPLIDTLRYDGSTDYLLDKNGRIVGMSDPTATDQRVIPYDNTEDFFQTAFKSDVHLSMSGGGEKGNYYTSIGHLDQMGIVPNSEFKRTTMKLTGDRQLTERLKVSGSAAYTNSKGTFMQKGSNLSAVMVGLMRVTPTFDITNGSSDPVNDKSAYMLPDGTQRNFTPNYDNPYWSVNKNKAFSEVNRLIGNSQFDYSFAPWLTGMYRIGIDYYNDKRKTYLDNNSSDTPDGYVDISTYEFKSVNSDLILTFNKSLTPDLNLTILGGHNYYVRKTYYNAQSGNLFILPDYYDISNTQDRTGDDSERNYKIVGVFYDFKIAFRNYLFFNTTGRNDWSSTLPPDKNSFFYPSFNVGFIFTDAFNITQGLPFFDYGKVRASWAEVGNDAPLYALEDYYVRIDDNIRGQVAFATSRTIGNKNIEPEKTQSTEFGIDLRFFKNRIAIDFAYYNSISDGQILEIPVPYSTGYSYLTLNSGIVSNEGIEIQLLLSPIRTSDFNWDIVTNFSKNKNIVEELPEGVPLVEFSTTGLSTTRSVGIEGEPFGVIYGGRYLRNENGDILVGDDGYPEIHPEAGVVGDPNPDFLMGIRNTFTYKGISLSALLDIRAGGDIYNGTRGAMTFLGIHKNTENRYDDYIFPGVNLNTQEPNTVPVKRLQDYYSRQANLAGLSEAYLEDGSYIRLREVSISYQLPSKLFENIPISGANFGLSGRNLWLKTNYSGIDPETNLSGASNSLGRDYFNMPNTKSYEFNMQINF
jgi:TonB-linked SusC/RagA family outer membrane protein